MVSAWLGVALTAILLTNLVESAALKRSYPLTLPALNEREIYEQIEYLLQQHGGRHQARQLMPRAGALKPQHVTNWPLTSLPIGDLAAVSVNALNHPVIFHRGNNTWESGSFDGKNQFVQRHRGPIGVDTILCLNATDGSVYHSMGKDRFYMPHGLHIDKDENIWVTDVGLHQVIKFPRGSTEPSLFLGEAFVPGKTKYHFCKPTAVVVTSSGDFFVSDGYCNSRIIKYSSSGIWLTEWGHSQDKNDFAIPHSMSLIEELDLLCVADREDRRILCYSAGLTDNERAGKFILAVTTRHQERVYSIANAGNGFLYGVAIGNRGVGLTIDLEIAEIVDSWNLDGNQTLQFPHDVDVSPDGSTLYVVEVHPPKISKFNLQ